jgi:hypothetical protein
MQITFLNMCRANIRIHCFMCAPQEAYGRVTWAVPDPESPSLIADGTPRFYVGAPPTDAEGQHMHYECFCSLLWGARHQHDSLHAKRAEALYNKAQVKHTQHILEHGIQPDQEDCDETGSSFLALLLEQTLKKEDVVHDVCRWELQWRRSPVQRQHEQQDMKRGISMWNAKARTHNRFNAMLTNGYGSRINYIHFMTHGAYWLESRHLPPPCIEAAAAVTRNVGAYESTSRIHPLPKPRPRFMNQVRDPSSDTSIARTCGPTRGSTSKAKMSRGRARRSILSSIASTAIHV